MSALFWGNSLGPVFGELQKVDITHQKYPVFWVSQQKHQVFNIKIVKTPRFFGVFFGAENSQKILKTAEEFSEPTLLKCVSNPSAGANYIFWHFKNVHTYLQNSSIHTVKCKKYACFSAKKMGGNLPYAVAKWLPTFWRALPFFHLSFPVPFHSIANPTLVALLNLASFCLLHSSLTFLFCVSSFSFHFEFVRI